MKCLWVGLLLLCLIGCAAGIGQPTPAPEERDLVEFPSLTFPGHLWSPFMPPPEDGTPTTVTGALSIPAGSGRLPAVVITHGCGSITSGESGWQERLNTMGYATLLVHSFGARHIPEVCSGAHQVNIASMLADAYGALALLADHPRIDAQRIAILGLSFGGRTALWSSYPRFQERYGNGSDQFAAYLAFYPASCYLRLIDETATDGRPIRLFHGVADDWIPLAPCRDYVERLQATGVDIDLFAYPDAHHGFDVPGQELVRQTNALSPASCVFVEQPDGRFLDQSTGREASIDAPCVVRGVSSGYNATAEQQAVADVRAFLAEVFGE